MMTEQFKQSTTRADWMADASCADMDTAVFFPTTGVTADRARAVCATCPVRVECLAYAIDNCEQHGIWGGLHLRERRRRRARTLEPVL